MLQLQPQAAVQPNRLVAEKLSHKDIQLHTTAASANMLKRHVVVEHSDRHACRRAWEVTPTKGSALMGLPFTSTQP